MKSLKGGSLKKPFCSQNAETVYCFERKYYAWIRCNFSANEKYGAYMKVKIEDIYNEIELLHLHIQ